LKGCHNTHSGPYTANARYENCTCETMSCYVATAKGRFSSTLDGHMLEANTNTTQAINVPARTQLLEQIAQQFV